MATHPDRLFPDSKRVIYEMAPLVQVICQLRFPPILRIESQPPADFQESIRNSFPLFEQVSNVVMPGIPAELAEMLNTQFNVKAYRFIAEDNSSVVELSTNAISLTSTKYGRWEQFREQFQRPLQALVDIYRPNFFTRIGLRYSDAIDRKRIGLEECKWSELLAPQILGELSNPIFEQHLVDARRILNIKIPDGSGSILLQHGLGKIGGSQETAYLIDFDFFTEGKIGVENVETILNGFNNISGRAFRWCITDKLSAALKPTELAPASK